MQKNFNEGEIHAALKFIHENLGKLKLPDKDLSRADLVCEEALVRLMKYADFNTIKYFSVRVRKSFGSVFVDISVPGDSFDFAGTIDLPESSEFSPESQEAIQNLLFRTFIGSIAFKHSRNFNTITVTALNSNYSSLYKVLTALALAMIAGFLMRTFLSYELRMMINDNVLAVITEVFLDGLRMCAVPIVFFSIILCFADMGNLRGIKKAGTKLFTWFIILQVIAVSIGFIFVILFGTGKGAGLSMTSGAAGGQDFSINLKEIIMNTMPDNLIKPFFYSNMLQLIILSVLMGLAAGIAGAKSILKGCGELNEIFMKITDFLLKIIPLIVFCSVSSMIVTAGFHTIISLLGVLCAILAAFAVMHIIYYLLVKFVARLNHV